ncbi:HET-domain-containing protein [Hyaloscypha bicolor E]|uniref:HET-domain-containing protein n=1 Tax=Hyaloscypha bicolor E TaxID=1095630 RepID=A0A2J6SJL8_9HELO|nr:HET-domain-containing protein [Hyaloscypha bicolor E]PMD50972.1 HET-domain-containing protein [Hyaloscypha bicolor E]
MYLRVESGTHIKTPFVPVITQEGDPAAVQYGVPTFRPVTSSGSQGTLSIASSWLKHCVEKHDCHKSLFVPRGKKCPDSDLSEVVDERSTIFPTRLLDLQAFNGGSLDIRLVEKPASGSLYATLSHCWGVNCDARYQATKSTLPALRHRMGYAELPKTYRDAISVCRSLGIRYVWIDSLCIIQDSKEDWASEAAKMADVYSNSHLTISADWSTNSEGGCFRLIDRPQGIHPEHAIRISSVLSNGERSCLHFYRYCSTPPGLFNYTHLASRAWAYQERILSRRNLHFTQHQLFWECRKGFASEDMVPDCSEPSPLTPSYLLNIRATKSAEQHLQSWCYQIISHYSDAKITFPTDRLPAVSALAKHFADELCSPYLAGLWLEGLWYTLSWYRRERQSTERPKNYIAPSWSWAAINAGVFWLMVPSGDIVKRVEIIDAMVDLVGDPFGQVSHGWIRVTGLLVENVSPLTKFPKAVLDLILPDYPLEPPPEKVHCLLLGERTFPYIRNYYLLLVISSKDLNVYERYGMGTTEFGTFEHWQEKTITII